MAFSLRPFRIGAAFAIVEIVCRLTLPAAGGTTGTLSGTVSDSVTHEPLAGATIAVASPSQGAKAIADRYGHFAFLALAPDTYTVSVTLPGYQSTVASGESVIADQTRTLNISAPKALQTIGKVTARAMGDLVRPGTSADVYSVNAVTQDKGAAFGGGGNLNSAWSALTAVPGVFVTPGQGGYVGAAPALSIRGGDYDQIGYEIDGVPVNRSFDNYPSGPTSSLGQQELQVYTGAAPANAEAQGLSGFINQVIRTGTYPAVSTISGDIGGPAYYHKLSFETSGSTSNRNFSYYVGLGGYNQDFRYIDQFQGSGVSQLYGNPLAPCQPIFSAALAPSCYTNGRYNGNTAAGESPVFGAGGFGPKSGSYVLGSQSLFTPNGTVADRDSVVNLHVGFPHKNGTKDDLQLLFVNNSIDTQNYDSASDQGGTAFLTALGIGTSYTNGYQYNGPTGVALPAGYRSSLVTYGFPRAATNGAPNTVANPAPIPPDVRDASSNNQGIFKAQVTHQIGPSALLKLYGYTYYSDWSVLSPNTPNIPFFGYPVDYELHAHTRGLSAQFTDQLGSKNLLNLLTSYTTSTTLRDNNSQYSNADREFATLVSSADPLAGVCYTAAGARASCSAPSTYVTFAKAAAGLPPAAATCGAGSCEYLAVENGLHATYNTVRPKFTSAALTDQWKPTNGLTIDGGLRFDRYEFDGGNTDTGPARTFFYDAYNLDNCVAAGGASIVPRATPGGVCRAGTTPANFTNPSGTAIEAYSEYQPRIGFTYSLTPTTVIRGNYGRFAQAPNSAYQQYDTLQANAPAQLYGVYGFQKYGFTTPNHSVVPPTSDNLDFSLERQVGRDSAIKLSPFRRVTQNQIQNFDLNQQTAFISGLNVGHQTSQGVEFELDKGNFARDGIAAKLSLAYTNSYIKYSPLSNGSSIIDPLNTQIKNYNAYTSFCAGHTASPSCAGGMTVSGVAAAPCYTTAGAPVTACTAADVANPYWNAPVQALLDPNGNYPTFDTFPSGVGSAVVGYGAPYTATLLLQYKHRKLAITPALQFFAGQRYGAPATTLGVAPDSCTGILDSAASRDPRYPYGARGGSGFNYADCASILGFATTATGTPTGGIPDPYTGKFDTIGAFAAPAQFLAHVQLSYDVTPRVSVVANLVNIVNSCFGGSKTAFTVSGACGYGVLAAGTSGAVGNTYNPGRPIQPYTASPYLPTWLGITPFGIYVSARAHI